MSSTNLFKGLALTLLLLAFGNTAFAGDFLNTKSLLKHATTADPGKELLVPRIRVIDNNGDDYPERLALLFRVFDPATRTRLFSTRERRVTTPAIPCSNPVDPDLDLSVEFLGEENTRTGMLLVLVAECFEQGTGDFREAIKTVLYMADTTRESGNTWIRDWSQDAISAHITNWDADQAEEVMLLLVAEDVDGNEEVTVKMLHKATGTQESSERYSLIEF